jgi:hypothetical protein
LRQSRRHYRKYYLTGGIGKGITIYSEGGAVNNFSIMGVYKTMKNGFVGFKTVTLQG